VESAIGVATDDERPVDDHEHRNRRYYGWQVLVERRNGDHEALAKALQYVQAASRSRWTSRLIFSRRETMRILSRFSILVLALFLALAPTFALAQTTGGGGTGGTTTSGGTGGTGTTSGTTSGTATTTTTATTTDPNANNLNWTWIVVGAVVLVAVIGLLVMSNNRSSSSSTTVRRN